MDIQAAILSLYLLFPTYTDGQAQLEATVKGSVVPAAERLSQRVELREFINLEKKRMEGSADSKTANSKLDGDELDLGIGNLENPWRGPQSEGADLDFMFEGINAAEVLYTNSMSRLALFEYGEEYFVAPKALCGRNSVVSVNKDCIVRTEYDDLYRMLERTVWKNGSSLASSTMLTRTRYTYASAAAKIPKFCGQEYIDEGRYLETRYNYEGKPTEIIDYGVEKNGSGGVKRNLKKKNNYTYDVLSRLVIESELENFEDGSSRTIKKIYTYSAVSKIPSVSYYENDVLRIQTNYKTETDYTQTVFFDGDFKITTEYRDNERTVEVTYIGDLEVSRRTF